MASTQSSLVEKKMKLSKGTTLLLWILAVRIIHHNHYIQGTTTEELTSIRRNESPVSEALPRKEYPVSAPGMENLVSVALVEIRCHAGISVVLEQAIAHLGPHIKIIVWHSQDNELFLSNLVSGGNTVLKDSHARKQLVLHKFDPVAFGFKTHAKGVQYAGDYWYQQMLTSIDFYQEVATPFVLNMQTDTLLCRGLQYEDLKATFIGGISGFITNWKPKGRSGDMTQRNVAIRVGPNPGTHKRAVSHLNGGFSLHNIEWTIECIEQYGMLRNWVEDDLYQYCHDSLMSSKPVSEVNAYAFASDNGKTMCFDFNGTRVCPLGVHKPWVMKKNGNYAELVSSCPGLAKLERLQFNHEGETCEVAGMDNSTTIQCHCRK